MRVLVVEDGTEYVELFRRFLGDRFDFERAGSGPEALVALAREAFDVAFLDMTFDRVPESALIGDPVEAADRFNGDVDQARRFLENNQGTYILAALRERGLRVPVLLSFDLSAEPRRFARLRERFGPVDHVPDGAPPSDVAARLLALAAAG